MNNVKLMVSVNIEFIGILQGKMGKKKHNVELVDSVTITTLIQMLEKTFKKDTRAISEALNPETDLMILVNGKEIGILNGVNTVLKDDSTVTFIPISHGG
ncbi:MAG: MoaD/ThiS family protein [Candidatus Bathyarchaeota archaeon]|nr:MAG: MoaD/ThiS family protein [Candidatus Bathyarchaeota archaeon]